MATYDDLGQEFSEWLPRIHDLMTRVAYLYAHGDRPADKRLAAFSAYTYELARQASMESAVTADSLSHVADELRELLMGFRATNVWQTAIDQPSEHGARCQHGGVSSHTHIRAISGHSPTYPLCDHLAWIGEKLLNQKYDLKNHWPEPRVYYSLFESDRSGH